MPRPRTVVAVQFALTLAACGDGSTAGAEGGANAETVTAIARCHAAWERVVSRNVVRGGLDFARVAADRGDLDAFLACVRRLDPTKLAEPDRLAFLSNAYNALVTTPSSAATRRSNRCAELARAQASPLLGDLVLGHAGPEQGDGFVAPHLVDVEGRARGGGCGDFAW
jgi:hypothetical protein